MNNIFLTFTPRVYYLRLFDSSRGAVTDHSMTLAHAGQDRDMGLVVNIPRMLLLQQLVVVAVVGSVGSGGVLLGVIMLLMIIIIAAAVVGEEEEGSHHRHQRVCLRWPGAIR